MELILTKIGGLQTFVVSLVGVAEANLRVMNSQLYELAAL